MSDTPTASPVVLGRWEKPGNLASLAALASSGQITIRPHELIRTTDGRVYHWTGTALEITSAPVHHGTVADVAALAGIYLLPSCTRGVHQGDTAYVTAAACEYRVTSGINATATWSACASIPSIPTTPSEVGADPSGTADAAVSTHNTATDSHADIRADLASAVSTHNTAPDSHADLRTAIAGKQDSLTISTVGTALLNLSTPTAEKIPRINADASVTLIDVPSVEEVDADFVSISYNPSDAVFVGLGFESIETFDDYAVGSLSTLYGGLGWVSPGPLIDHSGYVGTETFEDYDTGAASSLSAGSGFAAAGTLLDLSFNSGTETFEDYDTGNVSTLAGGSGFAGPATLTLYTE